jgi:methionyl-tRNA formyltransferase
MTPRLRIIFFGTPEFAVPVLEALAAQTEVALVVTQPDRPSGRGRKTTPPPVKVAAEKLGIDVIQPEIVKGRRFAGIIAALDPDFIISAAFGRILGLSVLGVPKKASLNVHASLLPRHRGAAPANWAILSGDMETGVSIMRMEKELDSGPVYGVSKTPIGSEESAGELLGRLSEIGAKTLIDTLENFDALVAKPQNEDGVTWAPMLSKSDGIVNWNRRAGDLHRQVRGMHPWPVATTSVDGLPLQIHSVRIGSDDGVAGRPGTVLEVSASGLKVACGEGVLVLLEVQAAGRKRLHIAQFLKGSPISPGAILGN